MKLFLTIIVSIAMIMDLKTGKIPNWWIASGMLLSCVKKVSEGGIQGLLFWFVGTMLPIVLLWLLFYFRMLGAGDIKLLAVLGGSFGAAKIFLFLGACFVTGAVCSLILMIYRRNAKQRFQYFFQYIYSYRVNKVWTPYRIPGDYKNAGICFTIPIFITLIFYQGGFF